MRPVLDRAEYGTHSVRRTKAALIYRHTKNPRALQLFLGHSKLKSTVRYRGIEVDDALDGSVGGTVSLSMFSRFGWNVAIIHFIECSPIEMAS